MANFLKAKLGVSLFSISILILIPLLESNFNAPVTIKRWGKLTWDDFNGFATPFSGYGAAISSQVYLEFDSTTSKFIAYAGQNNIRSWTKEKTKASDYALNHEQYHFNLTELHARFLNEYIEANPNESESFYNSRLYSIRFDLNSMQDQYDSETDHSLIQDRQRLWEFKIDSLLTIHSKDSGWVNDYYSGARIFFPDRPAFNTGFSEIGSPYRTFSLSKYDMTLSIASFQYEEVDPHYVGKNLREYYSRLGRQVKKFIVDTLQYKLKAIAVTNDSLKNTTYSLWILKNLYLYNVSASYRGDTTDTTGYSHIANSFIGSFALHNTDDYWIKKLADSKAAIAHGTVSRTKINENKKNTHECITFGESKQHGFFRGPMFGPDGRLIIAYDIIEHDDSLLYRNTLICEKDIYHYKSDSENHIYFIPPHALPKETFEMCFGYLLKQDSINECYSMKYQHIMVAPAPSLDASLK